MVYTEVTQDLARLGAAEVVRWVRRHHGQVEIAPSEVFAEFQALLTVNPNTRSQGRGEEAALEVLAAAVEADTELHAILLFEDNDIRSRSFVRVLPERVTALSPGDLLHELEAAARIRSSDHILDRAATRGRNIEKQRQPTTDAVTRTALRRQLRQRHSDPNESE